MQARCPTRIQPPQFRCSRKLQLSSPSSLARLPVSTQTRGLFQGRITISPLTAFGYATNTGNAYNDRGTWIIRAQHHGEKLKKTRGKKSRTNPWHHCRTHLRRLSLYYQPCVNILVRNCTNLLAPKKKKKGASVTIAILSASVTIAIISPSVTITILSENLFYINGRWTLFIIFIIISISKLLRILTDNNPLDF